MGTLTKIAAAAVLALILAGCANSPMQDQLLFCDGATALRPAPGETAKLSDSLVDQIDQHNTLGMEACGWKP